jgi:hypothetical protein
MAESNDYKVLKANLPQGRDRLDRVENVVVNGMPDINYCSEGVECWLEQKSPKEPVRATTRLFGSNHKVSQDQKNWFMRQMKSEGNAYFLIVTDKRWMLIGGEHADIINELTVGELLSLSLWNTPKPVRDKEAWNRLRKTLNSKQNRTGTN